MSTQETKPEPRRPKLRLPFDNRREDAGEWAFDHRAGLCVTLIAYLLLAIAFVGAKIVVGGRPAAQGFYIDLQQLEQLAAEKERLEREVRRRQQQEPIDWKSKELLGRIGMVFQEPEHQFAANFVRDEVSIGPKSMGQSQDEAYQTADRMLEQMNLTRFAKANPYTLSGGEKRRLSVASMLAAAPKVLVMDEPTFGQDFSTWNEMVKLIAAIRDQGSCVIMVTHDEALADALGARRVMFEEAKA